MPWIINPYRFGAPTSSLLVDTATGWWGCSDATGYYDSTADTILDRRGGGLDLLRGSAVGADSNDPAFGNTVAVSTYRHLAFTAASATALSRAHQSSLDPGSDDFTFVAVIWLTVTSSTRAWFTKRTPSAKGIALVTVTGELRAHFNNGSGTVTAIGPSLVISTPYIVAVRRSGSEWRLIVDGTEYAAQTVSGSADNTDPFRFGGGDGHGTAHSFRLFGAAWWKGAALSAADTVAAGGEILAAVTV